MKQEVWRLSSCLRGIYVVDDLLEGVILIAEEASRAILRYYGKEEGLALQQKVDKSPVTAADLFDS